ncbi:6-carboxy-5,6,7,8-tetrahydropterin synthase [Streptomyces anthocyanicus]|uniref:6-pyruvoyl trahydropterin synthase family protein n=1 Tax=Streptomyces TaxID=1883 RepID=UPI00087B6A73|nr:MULTISPECIES: 6-pyruvoyl tetrahydropterin synthase family protein [Streptomyces]REH24931.1 6-pyruvoyltetrahydropterin/6-carboxytetrahydropterin synthase [Streptomyces sp. 2221.1]GGL84878.1 6-carboxy-5,6,7,8-tetrahydropterin synthase [Streptomyces anthocyanicus]SDT79879.1 6-pyruvoyltetrahydropterin/6-carboxytetrahydropterin synthase [Streptomyces sp. 2114.2]
MFKITKEFHFSASHQLGHLPDDHQCARLHGHNYIIVIELSAPPEELTEAGFVRDYGDLGAFKKWIDATLDHRHLNDVMPDINASAENMAMWVYETWSDQIPELTAISVSETPKTWAEYRPSGRPQPVQGA